MTFNAKRSAQMPRLANKPPGPLDAGALLAWYDGEARQLVWRVGPNARVAGVRPDPYRVWLSEIMLQQTGTKTVTPYFSRFVLQWPDVKAFSCAKLDEVLAAWAGLGYYARARNLHATARIVAGRFGGIFPKTVPELQELPGIGPYTAAAIAAICHDASEAVVDGNVERVVARLFGLGVPVRTAKKQIRHWVSAAVPTRSGDFAQAMMDLGATVCTPKNPACPACPLRGGCTAFVGGDPARFPIISPKKPRPKRYGHAFVLVRSDGAVWLSKRPDTGLLAQMSQVPGSEWTSGRQPPVRPPLLEWTEAGAVRHVFTHFALELVVWRAMGSAAPREWLGNWVPEPELAGQALPTLFRKVLASAGCG